MDRRTRLLVVAGVAITVIAAGVLSIVASNAPDGLEKVAADQGFDTTEEDHPLADSPLADYQVTGVDDDRVGTGIAGVLGATITLVLMIGLLYAARARARRRGAGTADR